MPKEPQLSLTEAPSDTSATTTAALRQLVAVALSCGALISLTYVVPALEKS